MIYTCTMNTAIDLYVAIDNLKPNRVNRTFDEDYQANGKGVNVSIMLQKMGIENTALGFIGGFTGKFIEEELTKQGINSDFINVDGITRINVFVNADEEYKIVNQGPEVGQKDVDNLLQKIKAIPKGSILIVSGSLPRGVEESILVDIAKICAENDVNLVIDSSSSIVLETLPYRPYLLKPNEEELAHLVGKDMPLSEQEIIVYGKELLYKGAKNVIISRGGNGAIFLNDNHLVNVSSPVGEVVNTACSGDSLLAAFIAKTMENAPLDVTLKYAVATGASTAFSKGLSDLSNIAELMKQVSITNNRGD
ncbi:MAG: 1-phosphofructokinase [Bacillota bacterium]|uniref:1-phosphofructokinase n=1 Tax=unclassified Virgibacillus TaxID=2620237 RepID=UPI0019638A40|nr:MULTISPECIES: 1-phosphofructokinase [unclassified Virgibacillus]MCC2251199.1 1-phosphofructokinase [Virgibacillus sp. AGTR]MDY7045525.1 1-phosphofructokinase [Virgibacillus sp. M23]QRZ18718.1 1-phosphofructokinase [Virgibacillus sp. AGTR]